MIGSKNSFAQEKSLDELLLESTLAQRQLQAIRDDLLLQKKKADDEAVFWADRADSLETRLAVKNGIEAEKSKLFTYEFGIIVGVGLTVLAGWAIGQAR